MASNSFGHHFRITTWGESHGKAIGVVIDGCPAGLPLHEESINRELALRAPGKNPLTSPRKEEDKAEIFSGVFEGKTTGAPISILIFNRDPDSSKYEPIKEMLRPGHANFPYLQKYGIFDYRGGGRASARETACRVAAGAVAKGMLEALGIEVVAYIKEIGGIKAEVCLDGLDQATVSENLLFCPDDTASRQMARLIEKTKDEGDSLGGIVELVARGVSPGLGDPVYRKMDAALASAMMSIPAVKGVEIGSGFSASAMLGSQHNDLYKKVGDKIVTETNHAGGVLGGITTGMPLIARVCFKPPASIQLPQKTVDLSGQEAILNLPQGSRHDPCVAIRAVPVVRAMAILVIADLYLCHLAQAGFEELMLDSVR